MKARIKKVPVIEISFATDCVVPIAEVKEIYDALKYLVKSPIVYDISMVWREMKYDSKSRSWRCQK